MKRKATVTIGIVILIATIAWAIKIAPIRQCIASPTDLFFCTVYLFEDTTQWSPEYVEREFKRLKIGQSQEAVLKMLGQPLAKESYENGKKEVWRYSQGKIDSSYWFRTVVFDENKMVSEIDRHYDVD